jgi:hypothetical protein
VHRKRLGCSIKIGAAPFFYTLVGFAFLSRRGDVCFILGILPSCSASFPYGGCRERSMIKFTVVNKKKTEEKKLLTSTFHNLPLVEIGFAKKCKK